MPCEDITIDNKTEAELRVQAEDISRQYNAVDLSIARYKCITRYSKYYENAVERNSADGFLLPADDLEIKEYIFVFTETISEYATVNHTYVEFGNGDILVEVVNVNYNDNLRNAIASVNVEELQNVVNDLTSEYIVDGHSIEETTFEKPSFYIREGNLYAKIVANFSVSVNSGTASISVARQFIIKIS